MQVSTVKGAKKYSWWRTFCALCLSAIFVASIAFAQESNLVINGNFFEGESGWKFEPSEPNAINLDNEVVNVGKISLRIEHASETSYSRIFQQIEVEPETDYIASCWIKTEDLHAATDSHGATLFIGNRNGDAVASGPEFRSDSPWVKVAFPFNSATETKIILFAYLHKTAGKAWFEDIRIQKAPEKPASGPGNLPMDLNAWILSPGESDAIQMDADMLFDGKESIRIRHVKHASSHLKMPINLEPNTKYLVNAVVGLNNPYRTGSGCLGFRLQVLSPAGKVLASSNYGTGTTDRTIIDVAFDSGGETKGAILLDVYDAMGTVWIGSVNFQKISDPTLLGDCTPKDVSDLAWLDKKYVAQGFVAFVTDWMERVSTNRLPRKDEVGQPIRIAAAQGEYEPASIAIHAFKDLENVEVTLAEDLTSKTGKKISKDNIEIRFAAADKFALDEFRHHEMPVFLHKNKPLSIRKNKTQRYWLTVHVPETAAPGTYETEVVLKSANAEESRIRLELTVYPFQLDEPETAQFMYYDPRYVLKFRDDKKAFLDMQKHGMNTVEIKDVYTEKGRQTGAIETSVAVMKTQLANMKETGLYHQNIPVLFGYGHEKTWLATWCAPLDIMKRLLAERDAGKWPEILFYCVDEPNDEQRITEARAALNKIHASKVKAKTVTAIGEGGLKAGLGDLYDVSIVELVDVDQQILPLLDTLGKKLWFYDCRQNGKNPEVDRYSAGVYLYRMNGRGFGQWVYTDPNRTKDSKTRVDYGYVLVEADDLVPSIGWEGRREGVDDYKYLATLEALVRQAAGSGGVEVQTAAAEADDLLKSITAKIAPDSFNRRFSTLDPIEYRLDNKPQADIKSAQYDEWRKSVAKHIITLKALLAKP